MTPEFLSYIAPARRYPQLWRLLAGLVVIGVVHVAWSALVMLGAGLMIGRGLIAAPPGGLSRETIGASPGMMLMLLATFAGMGIGTVLAARLLHRRGLRSLIGPGRTALRHFLGGAALILAVNLLALAALVDPAAPEPALPMRLWLALLPLALLGVLVQTGAEELVFRGYLQQQLAARFSSTLVWMLLPSLAFGMLHYEPGQMGANAWPVVAITALFGLIAADLTARAGTLGLAWGLHFSNNLFALLLLSPQGDLSGLALYRMPFGADDTETMPLLLAFDAVLLLAIWAICRLALRRR
ncbi:CPBP family intramembrane glutamic endopeptidase [Alkalilacustris brevis]|uniref:CPBP family intramembrane glutamic endopeptidase n=1 Tax=Alkalilacustris brevis TaxID=2026338 RepID=UPI000E0DDBFA|nr:CPBP family intramembrane glutamic endopeptidase [Alkalilacustris brevis]